MLLGLDGHSAILRSDLVEIVDITVSSAQQNSFRCRDATIVGNIAKNIVIVIQLSLINPCTRQSHAAGLGLHVTIVHHITLVGS